MAPPALWSGVRGERAAGAVVLEGTIVEENTIYAGVPAKKVKTVEGKNREMLLRIAGNYLKYSKWFQDEN